MDCLIKDYANTHFRNAVSCPDEQILAITAGFWQSRALAVGTELELADLLAARPLHIDVLASRTKTYSPTLFRLLRALETLRVFSQVSPFVFANTPLANAFAGMFPTRNGHGSARSSEIRRMHAAVLNTPRRKRLCTANRRAATFPSVSVGRQLSKAEIGADRLGEAGVFNFYKSSLETGWMRSATTIYTSPRASCSEDKQNGGILRRRDRWG
jgi:hypothetical protein